MVFLYRYFCGDQSTHDSSQRTRRKNSNVISCWQLDHDTTLSRCCSVTSSNCRTTTCHVRCPDACAMSEKKREKNSNMLHLSARRRHVNGSFPVRRINLYQRNNVDEFWRRNVTRLSIVGSVMWGWWRAIVVRRPPWPLRVTRLSSRTLSALYTILRLRLALNHRSCGNLRLDGYDFDAQQWSRFLPEVRVTKIIIRNY